MNLFRNRITDIENKFMVLKGNQGRGGDKLGALD